jgi:hypothetical protein
MPVDESDLAFADFGGADSGATRLYPAPGSEGDTTNNNTPGASHRGRTGIVERETGFASQLRWLAQPSRAWPRTGNPQLGNVTVAAKLLWFSPRERK